MKNRDIIKNLLYSLLLGGQILLVAGEANLHAQAAEAAIARQKIMGKNWEEEKSLPEMVRALHYIHDEIARNEKGARAKQARLLGEIGRRFEQASPTVLAEAKNLYALVTYLFNGGNPHYVEEVINTIPSDVIEKFLLDGALAYAKGDELGLVNALGAVDLDKLGWGVWPQDLRLSVYLALVTHLAVENPKAAQERLFFVRTLAPGTLFEEAALRREVRLDALLQDSFAMRHVIHSYAARFGSSPYASDFWREIRLALPMLESSFDDDTLGALVAMMPEKEQYMLYLRMARLNLLEGRMERVAFTAKQALEIATNLKIKGQSVPARLYLAATLAATQQAGETIAMLQDVSRQDLPARDRPLFDVVERVAKAVMLKKQDIAEDEIEHIKSLVQTDETQQPQTPYFHDEVREFLTLTQEKLNQIDRILEQ